MQIAIAIAIALLALQNPAFSLLPVAVCATAIVFFSATQDIAFDAYRTDVSLPSERGPIAGPRRSEFSGVAEQRLETKIHMHLNMAVE